ncbi:hypothetical protein B0T18DRAFT_75575 [Schizothecium vesticola]|uniref:Uncharacterized protein n=1 Tax=Schizothecium vesticola TaxID=314040 RepID=A0AA40KA50_9PEZI|nr:hypothetical protein B0T18DRAFT_75575 [Schizothecium vesticola]
MIVIDICTDHHSQKQHRNCFLCALHHRHSCYYTLSSLTKLESHHTHTQTHDLIFIPLRLGLEPLSAGPDTHCDLQPESVSDILLPPFPLPLAKPSPGLPRSPPPVSPHQSLLSTHFSSALSRPLSPLPLPHPSLPRNLTSLLLLSTSLHHHRSFIPKQLGVREERSTIHTPFPVSSPRSIPLLAPPATPKIRATPRPHACFCPHRSLVPPPLTRPYMTDCPHQFGNAKSAFYLQTSYFRSHSHTTHSRPPW